MSWTVARTIVFGKVMKENPNKSSAEVLHLLNSKEIQLQRLLGQPYDSDATLRDLIWDPCRNEKFCLQLQRTDLPTEPGELRTLLHKCVRSQESITNKNYSIPADFFNVPGSANINKTLVEDDGDNHYEVYYSQPSSSRLFNWPIMGGNTGYRRSLSRPLSIRNHRPFFNSPRHWKYSNRNQHSLNPEGRDGDPLLCSTCNSWFHFQADFLHRTEVSVINLTEIQHGKDFTEENKVDFGRNIKYFKLSMNEFNSDHENLKRVSFFYTAICYNAQAEADYLN